MTDDKDVDIQVIVNLVVQDDGQNILMTKYNPEVDRWWLPGQDVEPFAHPDDQPAKIMKDLGLETLAVEYKRLQSFRGRRGWHLSFDYLVTASGEPREPARWFARSDLPKTMHGDWEAGVVADLLEGE